LGVLGQDKGPTFAMVAYLSKKTWSHRPGMGSLSTGLVSSLCSSSGSKKTYFQGVNHNHLPPSPGRTPDIEGLKNPSPLPDLVASCLLPSWLLHYSPCLLFLKFHHPLAHLYCHAYPLLSQDPSPLPFTHPGGAIMAQTGFSSYCTLKFLFPRVPVQPQV
jgi:hypothetical protein